MPIKIFPTTPKTHSNSSKIFSYDSIFQWRNHSIFKNVCTTSPNVMKQPHALLSWRAFQRHQEHNLKHLGLVNLIITKQNKLPSFIHRLVWPVSLAQVWTHHKIGKLNMWTLFYNVCINFLNSQIWKVIMLELNGKPSIVTTSSTDFFVQNLGFWNLFECLVTKFI
jgi:hypothetical protein